MRALMAAGQMQLDASSRRSPITGARRILKRFFDAAVSFVLLVLLSPVIAVFALLIKFQDGGPVFHRRRVIGPKGEFNAFKLRTMRVDADAILDRDRSLRREFE